MWPSDEFGVVRRADALAIGRTGDQIRRALRSGELAEVDRGLYVQADALPPGDVQAALYRLKCIRVATSGAGRVLSHESAAAVLNLPVLMPERRVVHVAIDAASGGRRARTRHYHCGLDYRDVVVVDGVQVTTPARTAVDIGACGTFAQALAAADSALRSGVSRDELGAMLDGRRRTGAAKLRAAVRLADGRSANPGESFSRAQMLEAGLVAADLQVRYDLANGSYAVVDFDWEGSLVGEFDGLRKYSRDLRPGERPEDAVVREKIREDELRDLGLGVVRWTWQDLRDGTMVARVRRALTRAGL